MNTQKKINRFTVVALAVALVVCLVVGSASALTISHQKISMPDPYGVMPLSLSSETNKRVIFNSQPITYGLYNSSSYRFSYASQSQTLSSSTLVNTSFASNYVGSSARAYLEIPAGTYLDYSANVSFSNSEYSSIVLSGSFVSKLITYLWPVSSDTVVYSSYVESFPSQAQFLVNGLPVGDVYFSSGDGNFTFTDLEVALTDSVTSVGIRFIWPDRVSQASDISSYRIFGSSSLAFDRTDNVNITPIAKTDVDYIPYFERVISWLQSISGSVNPLHDDLQAILNNLGGMSGLNADVARLVNIFARDDDIQLRDDMDETLKEATSIFYDTTENPSTAISTDTISSAGETLQGVSSMFDSGYEATDAFQEIADSKDDFMSWFTEDTYSWLDTVPSTYTREDDPYNTWMIENQYAEMAKRRGE